MPTIRQLLVERINVGHKCRLYLRGTAASFGSPLRKMKVKDAQAQPCVPRNALHLNPEISQSHIPTTTVACVVVHTYKTTILANPKESGNVNWMCLMHGDA
jgi:hypothetical protein